MRAWANDVPSQPELHCVFEHGGVAFRPQIAHSKTLQKNTAIALFPLLRDREAVQSAYCATMARPVATLVKVSRWSRRSRP